MRLLRKILYWTELFGSGLLASILLIAPFKWLKKSVLQKSVSTENSGKEVVDDSFLLRISNDIPRLGKIFPWTFKCYQQALTVRLMLNRRRLPNELSIGSKKGGEEKMLFHAWSSCNGVIVTGNHQVETYHTIHTFN